MALTPRQILSRLRARDGVFSKHDVELLIAQGNPGEQAYGAVGGFVNGGVPLSGLMTTPVVPTGFLGAAPISSTFITGDNVAGTITIEEGGAGVYDLSLGVVGSASAGAGSLTLSADLNGVPGAADVNAVLFDNIDSADAAAASFDQVLPTIISLAENDVISFQFSSATSDVLAVSTLMFLQLKRISFT